MVESGEWLLSVLAALAARPGPNQTFRGAR
jgi:hypothetical protein